MKFLENIKNKINFIKNKNESNKENLQNTKCFKIEKNMMVKLILLAIISCIIAVVLELFVYDEILKIWQNAIDYIFSPDGNASYSIEFSIIRLFMFIGIVFFIGLHFIVKPKKIYEFICDNRYIIASIFLVLVMVLGLNGSSFSRINYYLNTEDRDKIVEEFGVPRPIRSDEWGTQSLYILSQNYRDYAAKADLLRGTETDMFTLVNSPVKSLFMIGKPFLIMFLMLNSLSAAYGFYWFARITLMCLATYETMRILTNNKKILSLFGTILVSFSAAVQWWYCLDVLIWGQVILAVFNKFFETDKKSIKVLCGIGEIIGVLSYIFIFYPAWQISFGYIFIPILVLIVLKNIKKGNFKKVDIIDITIICVTVVILFAILVLWLITSIDTIKATTSTVYPGKRISVGTGEVSLLSYFYNMFMPYESFKTKVASNNYFENGIEPYANQCENSTMLSLFPIPMILALIYLIRNKEEKGKRDIFLIVSLVVSFVLTIYCTIGFPEWLSKLTLLHLSLGARAAVPLACLNVYMFIYLINKVIENENIKLIDNSIIPYVIAIVMTGICILGDGNNYLKLWEICVAVILFLIMFFLSLDIKNKIKLKLLMILMTSVTLIGGLTVNPVVKSVDVIENNKGLSKALQKYAKEDPEAIWIGNNMPFVVSNYMVANGVKTLSSTNVYPNEDMYRTLFGDLKEAEEVWNRYHHIEIDIVDDITNMRLYSYDLIKINLDYRDLNRLNVKYVLTTVNFDIEKSYMNVELLEVIDGKYMIYKILEQDALLHTDEKIENYREALPNAIWYADELEENETKELLYDNNILPVVSKIDNFVTNEDLENSNIRYILTKKNLLIEFPSLSVRERQVIGEYIIYEVINVEG